MCGHCTCSIPTQDRHEDGEKTKPLWYHSKWCPCVASHTKAGFSCHSETGSKTAYSTSKMKFNSPAVEYVYSLHASITKLEDSYCTTGAVWQIGQIQNWDSSEYKQDPSHSFHPLPSTNHLCLLCSTLQQRRVLKKGEHHLTFTVPSEDALMI